MNSRLASHVAWALLVLVAFIVGRFFSGDENAATGHGVTHPSSLPSQLAEVNSSATLADRALPTPAKAALSGPDIRVRTFNLLSIASRRERLRQLCDVLDAVTPENWREALDAFVRQSVTTGRRYPEEWRLMLDRVGEVVGAAAIDESMQSKIPSDRARAAALLTGWAAADPKAAQAWFEARSPEQQKALLGDFVMGLARSDPAAAAMLNINSPPDQRDSLFYHLMDAVFQHGGVKEGEELIATMRARNDPKSPIGALYFHVATRVIDIARLRQAPGDALEWADRNMGPGEAGPASMKEIVSFAAQADAAGTMKWVTDRTDRWTEQQTPVVFPIVATELLKREPDQFATWMNAHPDHPQHDVMAAAAVRELIKAGNPDGASGWAQSIGDAKMRGEYEQSVQISRQRAAAKKGN